MRLLGTITANAGAAKNNKDTAVPFNVAAFARIRLVSDQAGVLFEVGTADNFHSAAATGLPLPAANVATETPVETGILKPVVSIFNGSGNTANVRVYAV